MTSSRFTHLVALVVLALLVSSGSAAAQAEGRTPETFSASLTGDQSTFESGDFPNAEKVFVFGEGAPFTGTVSCNAQGGCSPEADLTYGWISDPLFNDTGVPGSFRGTYTASFTLSGNTFQAGPVASGPVEWSLEVGLINPGANLAIHSDTGTATSNVSDPTGAGVVPLGTLETSVSIPFNFPDHFPPVQPGGRLALRLSLGVPDVADFSFSADAFPTLDYYIGDPDAADTDGDGIPDSLDDDADDDGFDDAQENLVGSSPTDATSTPASTSESCPGFTYSEVYEETGNPTQCPDTGGFPWLLLIVLALVIVLLLGGGFAVLTVAGRKVKMTVSHDGFQAIEQGQTAEYELELVATGKKEEIVPVELALKGVPEDWSATLEPAHLTLYAGGEEPEPQTAILRLTPPADEQYEAEAQVVVTATPTDEEGKTSALNPGSSVKTKTIANIGITDPEGGKKKSKPKKEEAADEEPAEAEAGKSKRAGFLKRKPKEETVEEEAVEDAEAQATAAEAAKAAAPAAAGAAGAGKPQIGMGKMSHDPEDFSEGDEVTTTVTVRNKGEAPVEGLRLNLFVNDEKADTQVVKLGPGDSADVSFNWTAQPDENRVRIKGGLKGA